MGNKILVANGTSYAPAVKGLGAIDTSIERFLSHPEEYKLVLFTGGEDVSPELYNHTSPNNMCFNNPLRDEIEAAIFSVASVFNIPMTGICRGSQFLNVMCGGTLMHDIQNHTGAHLMATNTHSKPFSVTSTHHQMCVPGEGGYIIGWSPTKLSDTYVGDKDEEVDYKGPEVEAITYPEQKVFAVQYHPEYMSEDGDGYKWFNKGVYDLMTLSPEAFKKKYYGEMALAKISK